MLRQEVTDGSAGLVILLEAPSWVPEEAGQWASIPPEPLLSSA